MKVIESFVTSLRKHQVYYERDISQSGSYPELTRHSLYTSDRHYRLISLWARNSYFCCGMAEIGGWEPHAGHIMSFPERKFSSEEKTELFNLFVDITISNIPQTQIIATLGSNAQQSLLAALRERGWETLKGFHNYNSGNKVVILGITKDDGRQKIRNAFFPDAFSGIAIPSINFPDVFKSK